METFIYIIFSILALIGVSTVIKSLVFLIFRLDSEKRLCNVILLNNENPEIVIRNAVEQIKWSEKRSKKTFALDCEMSSNAKNAAELLLKDYNIELCDKNNIGEKMSEK